MKLYRPATVLVGVLFVLLGGLTRLLGPDHLFDDPTRELARGTIGQRLEFNGSTVTVNRIRFAKALVEHPDDSDEKAVQSDGIFIAVEYDAERGPEDPGGNEVTLTAAGGTEYHPVSEGIMTGITFPEPGFAQSGSFVFEVNPSDLEGLTFKVTTTQFWTVLAQDLAIDLAIPSEGVADQLVDDAAPEYVMPKSIVRVGS